MPVFENPKIDGAKITVKRLLAAIGRYPRARFTTAGAIPIPPFNGGPIQDARYHYQGVAPFNIGLQSPINGVICASSSVAYFSLFNQSNNAGSIASDIQSVVVPNESYFHAGGMQMLGGLLPVPLESSNSDKKGLVAFYDVSRFPAVSKYNLDTPSRKASATAITSYNKDGIDYALLFVYEYDNFEMYIYRGRVDQINGTASSAWTLMRTYTGSAFNAPGTIDKQYQNFALVTQTNTGGDAVYLLGFRQDQVLVLWSINLTSTVETVNGQTRETTFGEPTLDTSYSGWSGADWANGVGLQIRDSTVLRIYATDSDPTGTSTYPGGPASYRFNLYVYA